MNLNDLDRPVDSKRVSDLLKSQFGSGYNIQRMSLGESLTLSVKTKEMISEYKRMKNYYTSQNDASFMKLLMINEAAEKRANELTRKLRESTMNKQLIQALKIAAQGGKLTEGQLKSLNVSNSMRSVLRDSKAAQAFMRKIVESRRAKTALTEGEIDQAQTTIAAQDIADQIQGMIEKFADIKYKELPALHDSIRNAQGVEAAEQFNTSLIGSLDELTGSLESAKKEVNSAIAVLTGQEVAGDMGDLDLGDDELGSEVGDMGDEEDMGLGDEGDEDLDFDLDLDGGDEDEVDLGRERR